MSEDRVKQFTDFRKRMNERILAEDNQVVRRFFALDTQTYKAGALDVKTKEMLGLVASMVLRCDDCIAYHVAQCKEAGVNRDEMFEALTLVQTQKVTRFPVVLVGSAYWSGLLDWLRSAPLTEGKINAVDLDLLCVTDDVDECIAHLARSAKQSARRDATEAAAAQRTVNDGE